MRKIFQFSLLIAFGLMSFHLHAQDWLITNAGDTIYGEISLKMPEELNEKVIINTGTNSLVLPSNRITSLQIDSALYKSIKHGDKYRIMKEVISGYLGLYTFRFEENYDFGPQYLYKVTGEGIEVPNLAFRLYVSNFLSDCKSIVAALDNKEYKRSDLEQLIKDYNNACVSEESFSESSKIDNLVYKLSELRTLLKDFQSKKNSGEPVPDYLIKALKEMSNQDFDEQIMLIIESLED